MPYINVSTSAKIEDKKKLLEEISILVSSLTNKSKRFVMAKLDDNCEMYFDDESLCCYLEIKSIGSLSPSEMAKPICNFICEKIGVPLDKIYICFEDFPAEMWGWNGRTFA
jgi:phenylpyruvate tautomerase|tara:strand:+ start:1254 stop:1586 length:333 start_codon:yes stop_codon:yes gene_type:complete